jgi:hypothetical protein
VIKPTDETRKHRRIYALCTAIACVALSLLVAFLIVLALYPQNRRLHDLVSFSMIGAMGLALPAVLIMMSLPLTRHIKVERVELPYTMPKDPALFWVCGVISALILVLLLPPVFRRGAKTDDLLGITFVIGMIWLMAFFIARQRLIVDEDGLRHEMLLRQASVSYRDMTRVEVAPRSNGQGGAASRFRCSCHPDDARRISRHLRLTQPNAAVLRHLRA